MAKCNIEPIIEVTLKLTKEEFLFLGSLLGFHIVGAGKLREVSVEIYTALEEARKANNFKGFDYFDGCRDTINLGEQR